MTVRVNAGPPAAADAGARLVNIGFAEIVNCNAAGADWLAGAVTSTDAVPGVAMRFAGTAAAS